MSSHPGCDKADIGVVTPPTDQQCADARTYISDHHFADEADILAYLGLGTA